MFDFEGEVLVETTQKGHQKQRRNTVGGVKAIYKSTMNRSLAQWNFAIQNRKRNKYLDVRQVLVFE